MKKLFISCPMKGRTEENIRKSMEKMHRIAEAVWEQELEVIPSYIEDKPPENAKQAVWYLGENIKKLADADYFIGVYYGHYNGCDVERDVAHRYGIPDYTVEVKIAAPDACEVTENNCVMYGGGGGN